MDPDNPYILNYDFELTATELLAAYDENEVAADQKYKGKKKSYYREGRKYR